MAAIWSHGVMKSRKNILINVRMILLNLFNLAFLGTFSSNRSGEVLV